MIKIDVQGAEKVRDRLGDGTIYVFLLPPSAEALEQRLIDRATEDPASLQARRQQALSELALKDTYDHQVVNDDAARAAQEILAIIDADRAARRGSARHERRPAGSAGPRVRRRQRGRLQGV